VLAIPPRAPAKPSAQWPGDRVAVAVDLDDYTMVDARAAARLARRFKARVVLVHVLPAIQRPPWMRLQGNRDARRLEKAAAEVARVAEALGPGTDVETRVLIGNPAEAIASFTRKERLGLAILTLRRGKVCSIVGKRNRVPCECAHAIEEMADAQHVMLDCQFGCRPETRGSRVIEQDRRCVKCELKCQGHDR
jgi:hypothetical protein